MKKTIVVVSLVLVLAVSGSVFAGIFGSAGNAASLLTGFWNYALTVADIAVGGVITRQVTSASITNPSPTNLNEVDNVYHFTGSTCSPATYENQVHGIGHNLSNTFVRLNTGYPTTLFGMESNFCNPAVNLPHVEFYWRSTDTTGTLRHLLEATMAHNGSRMEFLIGGDIVNIQDHAGTQLWKIDTTVTPWQSFWFGRTTSEPHQINSSANGCPWIQQRNSANSAYLAYPCFRDVNGGTAGGEELLYSNSGNVPWYSIANPQAGTTWPTASFAFQQSASSAHGDTVLQTESPSASSLNQWALKSFGHTTDIFGTYIENQSNGYAVHHLQVPSGGGDAFSRYYNGVTYWSAGQDNSDADAYVISQGNLPGTNNRLRIDTGGAVTHAGIALASVATTAAGTTFYCNNCNVATPCTSGGAGAWAFRTSGGTWACPF